MDIMIGEISFAVSMITGEAIDLLACHTLICPRLDMRFGYDQDLVGHVDIKRLREGGSGGIFLSAYVDW
jgi:hypothetical protein